MAASMSPEMPSKTKNIGMGAIPMTFTVVVDVLFLLTRGELCVGPCAVSCETNWSCVRLIQLLLWGISGRRMSCNGVPMSLPLSPVRNSSWLSSKDTDPIPVALIPIECKTLTWLESDIHMIQVRGVWSMFSWSRTLSALAKNWNKTIALCRCVATSVVLRILATLPIGPGNVPP